MHKRMKNWKVLQVMDLFCYKKIINISILNQYARTIFLVIYCAKNNCPVLLCIRFSHNLHISYNSDISQTIRWSHVCKLYICLVYDLPTFLLNNKYVLLSYRFAYKITKFQPKSNKHTQEWIHKKIRWSTTLSYNILLFTKQGNSLLIF